MKITMVVASPAKVSGFGSSQNEDKPQRLARMRDEFWTAIENEVLIPVGKILATKFDADRTLADILMEGESIEMDTVSVEGVTFPLAAGFEMTLQNLATTWGCPACHSAHGSGVYPSRDQRADLLAGNKFFYRPYDATLLTISDTCWKDYVVALGANKTTRFVSGKNWHRMNAVTPLVPQTVPVPQVNPLQVTDGTEPTTVTGGNGKKRKVA